MKTLVEAFSTANGDKGLAVNTLATNLVSVAANFAGLSKTPVALLSGVVYAPNLKLLVYATFKIAVAGSAVTPEWANSMY